MLDVPAASAALEILCNLESIGSVMMSRVELLIGNLMISYNA